MRILLRVVHRLLYLTCRWGLRPVNLCCAWWLRKRYQPGAVLHISQMVHIASDTVRILRRHGIRADYLAVGESPVWKTCDFHFRPSRLPLLTLLRETLWVWRIVSRYEIVHLHFMLTLTRDGWELPLLKRMGRKVVVHYRGCEIRDRERNLHLHPLCNICQQCDYNAEICRSPIVHRRRELAARYGDRFLVTTPDMLDFAPQAQHMPFFAPPLVVDSAEAGFREINSAEIGSPQAASAEIPSAEDIAEVPAQEQSRPASAGSDALRPFRIVHATNHPGIEGTDHIAEVIDRLNRKGFCLEFVFLKGVSRERVLQEYRRADLAIGKMKMGYYANSQIESLSLGVPTVTFVRPEFLTPQLERSGFIFSSLADLEDTLEHYLQHPAALEEKRRLARSSVLALHNNRKLAERYAGLYRELSGKNAAGQTQLNSRNKDNSENKRKGKATSRRRAA